MVPELPPVLTPDKAAKVLQCTPKGVVAELEAGRLRGFRIDDEWRTTLPDLLEFIGHPVDSAKPIRGSNGLAITLSPSATSVHFEWKEASPFTYEWPSRSDEQALTEEYTVAFECSNFDKKPGRGRKLLIGFTNRNAAGMEDRRRATVFLVRDDSRSETPTLYPILEFAGANDFESTRRLASVIKLPSRKQLKQGEPVPPEYRDFELAKYSEIVEGPYASKGMAVVVSDDDLDSMARHALIRMKWGRGVDFEL